MLRCLGHTAAHGLLSRRDHYQDWLGIETRMRQPSPQLTTFLAQSTGMAEHMSCKVTSCLTMFALQLVLHKASTAPTWSSKCLTAALLTSLKQRWHKHKLPFRSFVHYFLEQLQLNDWKTLEIYNAPHCQGKSMDKIMLQQSLIWY